MKLMFTVLLLMVSSCDQLSQKSDSSNHHESEERDSMDPQAGVASSSELQDCSRKPTVSCCKADTAACESCTRKSEEKLQAWTVKCSEEGQALTVYNRQGKALIYEPRNVGSCNKNCSEAEEAPESIDFRDQCLARNFEVVPDYCCSYFCTGKVL